MTALDVRERSQAVRLLPHVSFTLRDLQLANLQAYNPPYISSQSGDFVSYRR